MPDTVLVAPDGAAPTPPGVLRLPSERHLLGTVVAAAVERAVSGRAGPGEGVVAGVVGAVGGAGASTLALALAVAGHGWLLDADATRSGTLAATGAEQQTGVGWDDLDPVPEALADALPRVDGVPLLGRPLGRASPAPAAADDAPFGAAVAPGALLAGVAAARREAPVVVVDLPGVAGAGPVWRAADVAVLVVPDAVPAALVARAAVRHLRRTVPRVAVVVRARRRGGPGPEAVGEVVAGDGAPVELVAWGWHEALPAAADAGDLGAQVRRGPTAAAARRVLDQVAR